MIGQRATLKQVSTSVIEQLRDAVAGGALKPPLDRAALVGFGVRHQLEAIEQALAGHKSAACLTVLDVSLAEREDRKPTPELVWTGPEAPAGMARDTAVVLRNLFEGARESVILGGYSFTHARDVLAPLHRSMCEHAVDARFFVHVPQVETRSAPDEYLERHLGGFLSESWPFGEPRPRIYYDKRSLIPGPPYSSLHAKCVVVDGARALVSSANFTQRAQEQNIEVGVLIDDASFATFLAGQWLRLIETGIVGEFGPARSR
jgi:phosphatidylserine/phosphatidylglycerophosphate/cardiolipin synthase-like enzyme